MSSTHKALIPTEFYKMSLSVLKEVACKTNDYQKYTWLTRLVPEGQISKKVMQSWFSGSEEFVRKCNRK